MIAFEEMHHHAIPGCTTVLYAAPLVQQLLQEHLPDFFSVCRSFNSTCKKLGLCVYWCGGQITTVEELYQKISAVKKNAKGRMAYLAAFLAADRWVPCDPRCILAMAQLNGSNIKPDLVVETDQTADK